ncbi:hypothetical protein FRC96_15070 [Lujinxingia vulgaris]|uniref:Uncharacterized protein n=1 Tax=Lujinxingia vulgaris TaxID=2600176 RepID=A0A5C6WYF7_9DELT|nr:hypothetical protein [Lujinxingia vulgaris]TXD33791.1 hypothetical protein FRC96_15070 [Lujinxingia vulgaris]
MNFRDQPLRDVEAKTLLSMVHGWIKEHIQNDDELEIITLANEILHEERVLKRQYGGFPCEGGTRCSSHYQIRSSSNFDYAAYHKHEEYIRKVNQLKEWVANATTEAQTEPPINRYIEWLMRQPDVCSGCGQPKKEYTHPEWWPFQSISCNSLSELSEAIDKSKVPVAVVFRGPDPSHSLAQNLPKIAVTLHGKLEIKQVSGGDFLEFVIQERIESLPSIVLYINGSPAALIKGERGEHNILRFFNIFSDRMNPLQANSPELIDYPINIDQEVEKWLGQDAKYFQDTHLQKNTPTMADVIEWQEQNDRLRVENTQSRNNINSQGDKWDELRALCQKPIREPDDWLPLIMHAESIIQDLHGSEDFKSVYRATLKRMEKLLLPSPAGVCLSQILDDMQTHSTEFYDLDDAKIGAAKAALTSFHYSAPLSYGESSVKSWPAFALLSFGKITSHQMKSISTFQYMLEALRHDEFLGKPHSYWKSALSKLSLGLKKQAAFEYNKNLPHGYGHYTVYESIPGSYDGRRLREGYRRILRGALCDESFFDHTRRAKEYNFILVDRHFRISRDR